MPKVIVKRETIPNSTAQRWVIVDHVGELPDRLIVGLNGGYAGIWNSTADYFDGERMRSARTSLLRTWTELVGEGIEQTRFAEVEIHI